MKLKYYPIHTHYLPKSLNQVELVGAIICIEMKENFLNTYYGYASTKQKIGVLTFLKKWDELSRNSISLGFRPYFAIEDETGIEDISDLPELRTLGLISIQLQRKRKETIFFHPKTGVTGTGKILLYKMADFDIFLDLSHLHGPVLNHIIDHAPGRRIVSHVVCKDLFPWSLTTRANSMSAEELLKCDAQLYGVPSIDDLISPYACEKKAKRSATIRHVAEHIVKLTEIVGLERVALGPDYFDYTSTNNLYLEIGIITNLDQKQGPMQLRNELEDMGLSQEDIASIFWGNAWRVFPTVTESYVA